MEISPTDTFARLAKLRESFNRRSDLRDLYALNQQFILNKPLNEETVAAFEREWRITLPSDYRNFLISAGNGGAGPDYGIHKLGMLDDDELWETEEWLIGNLSEPFPHSKPWNPLPFDTDDDEREDELLEEFEAEYMDLAQSNGAMPVCHHGCNIRYWLVVTGPERGNIWLDRRTEWGGLSPMISDKSNRITFAEWYLAWLADAEKKYQSA